MNSKCKRCKHEWTRRHRRLPQVCPLCKSPYWNKPRQRITLNAKESLKLINKKDKVITKAEKQKLKKLI